MHGKTRAAQCNTGSKVADSMDDREYYRLFNPVTKPESENPMCVHYPLSPKAEADVSAVETLLRLSDHQAERIGRLRALLQECRRVFQQWDEMTEDGIPAWAQEIAEDCDAEIKNNEAYGPKDAR